MTIDALFCASMDPWAEPKGGQATFAKQLLDAFQDRLAVAGVTSEDLPLRKWIYRSYKNKKIKFFNMGKIRQKDSAMPIIPLRLKVYFYAKISMPTLHTSCRKNILIESPEILFAAKNFKWNSVCYSFPGVNNPVSYSRYKWARKFGNIFEKRMFSSLKKINAETMLAAASYKEIDEMIARSNGQIKRNLVHHFPTRVDLELFNPSVKIKTEKITNSDNKKIIVSCGRISWVKGWDLLLESISILLMHGKNIQAIFVGDGEDRLRLLKKAKVLGIDSNILVTGFVPNSKVKHYLNVADLCVVASFREGWSLAMLEMLACGKAIVSTDVSGAKEMIHSGLNGFIVKERNPAILADAISNAFELKNAEKISLEIAKKYSTKTLCSDLGSLWEPLSENSQN